MKINNYEKVDAVLGVDAGNISVADVDYIISKGGKIGKSASQEGKIIELSPGKYKVKILIAQSYNGRVNKTFNLETKGKIYVGDICYAFSARDNISNEAWGNVLSETNDLRTGNKNIGIVDTGGEMEVSECW